MDKAIIIVGKEDLEGLATESYQLLIGTDYFSYSYNETMDNRNSFIEEVSEEFGNRIVEDGSELVVGILNGYKIDTEYKKIIKINRLDSGIVQYLSSQLSTKLFELSEGRVAVIPVAETN